jgi:hypothetical protein
MVTIGTVWTARRLCEICMQVPRGTQIYLFLVASYTEYRRTAGPILMLDGSFDEDLAKEVLLGVGESTKKI